MRPACHKMGKKVATSCAEEGSLQAGIGFSISPGQALFSGDFIGEAALELVQGELLSPRCMLHMSKLALQLLYLSFCCTGLVFPLRNRAGGVSFRAHQMGDVCLAAVHWYLQGSACSMQY